jgi:hypothetical protein
MREPAPQADGSETLVQQDEGGAIGIARNVEQLERAAADGQDLVGSPIWGYVVLARSRHG